MHGSCARSEGGALVKVKDIVAGLENLAARSPKACIRKAAGTFAHLRKHHQAEPISWQLAQGMLRARGRDDSVKAFTLTRSRTPNGSEAMGDTKARL